jgi:hypothetical protein
MTARIRGVNDFSVGGLLEDEDEDDDDWLLLIPLPVDRGVIVTGSRSSTGSFLGCFLDDDEEEEEEEEEEDDMLFRRSSSESESESCFRFFLVANTLGGIV